MELHYYERHECTKYVVNNNFEHTLLQNYEVFKPYDDGLMYLRQQEDGRWCIGARPGFAWDGATKWFDTVTILKGSLVHDILHILIAKGCVSVYDNNKIDRELELTILQSNKNYPFWKGGTPVLRLRARLVRRGTNLVNEKLEDPDRKPKIHILP